MNFTDKIALVTGGGNGIGRASALLFAEHGAAVVVVDNDAAAAADTARLITEQGGDALDVAADVSRSDQVQAYVAAALRKHDRIDCFFNNAGIEGQVAPTAEYDEDVFDSVMAVNVKGVFLGLRHVLPVMLKQGSGTVVNSASIAGLVGAPAVSYTHLTLPTTPYV